MSAPTLLFIGDSITEAGRDHADQDDLGRGWVSVVDQLLRAESGPARRLVNLGIGGNRLQDLAARWQRDCLDLRPAVVTIQIGINDTWRRFDGNEPSELDRFVDGYRELLRQFEGLVGSRIVLVEPFCLPTGVVTPAWREDLDPRIAAVVGLAEEFDAARVPLDRAMADAAARADPAAWTTDGVHPTPAGHALIAGEWLAATTAGSAARRVG